MIYDCFCFFNEHLLLDVRLNTLYDYVDKFILIEATKSHQNANKELHYFNNKHLYDKFQDKIIHIVIDKYPDYSYWSYEIFQRDYIFNVIKNIAKSDDLIFVSDVDEIWNPQILKIDYIEMKLIIYL